MSGNRDGGADAALSSAGGERNRREEPGAEICGIYLAGGSGSRFGSNKLLFPWRGKQLYRYGLEQLWRLKQEGYLRQVYVVSRYAEILTEAKARRLVPVESPESQGGVSYSIRNGIAAMEQKGDRSRWLMFFVADQPDMSLQTLREFLRCLEGQGCRLACLTDGLHPGNPCVFHRSLIPELQALTGDRGGRALFAAHPHEVYQHLVCDPSQLRDVDFKVHP